jgi:uncharacterized damage-inducible protein DinB
MNTADRYRRWFAYERDSHQAVLQYLNRCAAEVRRSPAFQQAIDLMAHIAAARRLWLARLGVSREQLALRDLEPTQVALSDLPALVEKAERAWAAYLERLDDTELAREFAYQSLEGGRFRNQVADILTQLYGHSLYHRGQIALLVRQAGGQPVSTDFLFWARESVPESPAATSA